MLSNLKLAIGGGLLVAAFYSGWLVNGWRLELSISEIRTDLSAKETEVVTRVLEREREIKRKHDEIAKDAKTKISELQGRISGIRSTNDRLRDALSNCSASGDSSDSSGTTGEAVDLRPIVLGEVLSTASELAEYADRLRVSGEACVLSYEALRSPD